MTKDLGDLGDLGRTPDKNLTNEVMAALEAKRVESLPDDNAPDLPRSQCDITVYSGDTDEPTGLLLPQVLRINGQAVYTPVGTVYEVRGGGQEPLQLAMTLFPTSLAFLPGSPPEPESNQPNIAQPEGEKLP